MFTPISHNLLPPQAPIIPPTKPPITVPAGPNVDPAEAATPISLMEPTLPPTILAVAIMELYPLVYPYWPYAS